MGPHRPAAPNRLTGLSPPPGAFDVIMGNSSSKFPMSTVGKAPAVSVGDTLPSSCALDDSFKGLNADATKNVLEYVKVSVCVLV